MTQARAKLNPIAFRRLNDVAVNSFYGGTPYSTWINQRVLAVDGSNLPLPGSKSISEEFGTYQAGRNADQAVNMAKCSLPYDVLNLVTIDSQLGGTKPVKKIYL